jgi:hypothetical protein
VTKFYLAGSQRMAMRTGSGLTFLFGDQLGSTSVTYRLNDGQTIWQLYRPWGVSAGDISPLYRSGNVRKIATKMSPGSREPGRHLCYERRT